MHMGNREEELETTVQLENDHIVVIMRYGGRPHTTVIDSPSQKEEEGETFYNQLWEVS